MKKLYLLLVIALMPCFARATNESLSADTLVVDTLQLSNNQAFNLCFYSLEYWWQYAKIQDSIMTQKDSMLTAYKAITGVQSQRVEEVETLYNLKRQVEMDEQSKALAVETERKKKWRRRAFAAAGVAILEGFGIYFLIK